MLPWQILSDIFKGQSNKLIREQLFWPWCGQKLIPDPRIIDLWDLSMCGVFICAGSVSNSRTMIALL